MHVLYPTVDNIGDGTGDPFKELATLNGASIANLTLANIEFL